LAGSGNFIFTAITRVAHKCEIMYLILYSAEQVSEVSFPMLLRICRHQTGIIFCL